MIPILALVLFVRVRGILAPCARVWGSIPVRDQERGVWSIFYQWQNRLFSTEMIGSLPGQIYTLMYNNIYVSVLPSSNTQYFLVVPGGSRSTRDPWHFEDSDWRSTKNTYQNLSIHTTSFDILGVFLDTPPLNPLHPPGEPTSSPVSTWQCDPHLFASPSDQ